MKKRTIVERPGWDRVSAVRADHIYEIKSTYILQPGPAALTEGVARLHRVHRASGAQPLARFVRVSGIARYRRTATRALRTSQAEVAR